MDQLSSRWIQKFFLVNNPMVSVYYIHLDIFPTFVGIIVSVIYANIVGSLTSITTGLFVALPLVALAFALTYFNRSKTWDILIKTSTGLGKVKLRTR
jgi:uncharacterized membrane protein YobD (UPF0266 family)